MFGTSGIRGRVGDEVTAALALSVGRAVSEGTTGSSSAATFERAARCSSRRSGGTARVRCRRRRSRRRGHADDRPCGPPPRGRCGVVVTASHNPATDNGLKLWTPSGKAFGPDQRAATERRIREDDYGLAHGTGSATEHVATAFGTTTRTRSSQRWTSSGRRASSSISGTGPAA